MSTDAEGDAEVLGEGEEEPEEAKQQVTENISTYQIPWDKERRREYFRRDAGYVVVVTLQDLTKKHLKNIKKEYGVRDYRVYKSRFDKFNSRYIINALIRALVYPPKPEKKMIGEGGEDEPGAVPEEPTWEEQSDENLPEEEKKLKAEYQGEIDDDLKEDDRQSINYGTYNFDSDSGDSAEVYTTDLKNKVAPLTDRDRYLLRRLQEMELINARALKKDKRLLKILFQKFFIKRPGDEETDEEEVEPEPKRAKRAPKRVTKKIVKSEGDGLDDGEEYRDDGSVFKSEDDSDYLDESMEEELEMYQLDRLGMLLYEDYIRLYKMDSYYITDLDIRNMDARINTINNYDFPMDYYPSYDKKHVKTLSFMEYRHLLDYLEGPVPKYHMAGQLSRRRGFYPIGRLQKARGYRRYSKPRKQKINIRFTDVDEFGDYEKFEMIMDGKLLPRDFKAVPKTALDLASGVRHRRKSKMALDVLTNRVGHRNYKIPIGDPFDPDQFATIKKEAIHRFPPGAPITLPMVIKDYARRELKIADEVVPLANNYFQVISTVMGATPRPKFTLGRCNDDSKYFMIRTCATVIFDISRSRSDVSECWYFLKQFIELFDRKEINDKTQFEKPLHLVLITSFLTWEKSDKTIKNNISEENFLKRVSHPDYLDFYALENFVYKIGQNDLFKLKTTIVYTGIPYGKEEDVLLYLFKLAWDNELEIPLWSAGKNVFPLVYVEDLAEVVVKIINQRKYPKIVFAVAPHTVPLQQVAKLIADKLGNARIVKQTEEYKDSMCIPKIIYDLLQMDIRDEGVESSGLLNRPRHIDPFASSLNEIINELKFTRRLGEITIILIGPPSKFKFEIAYLLGKFYELPVYHKDNIYERYQTMMENLGYKEPREAEEEEDAEEEVGEEEEGQKKVPVDEEMAALKRVIDNKTNDASNALLARYLRKLLTSTYVKNHGYILVDFPLREKDANNVFKEESPKETAGEDEGSESMKRSATFPEYIFIIDSPESYILKEYIVCQTLNIKSREEMLKDLDEYYYYKKNHTSFRDSVERKNIRMFPFNAMDCEEVLQKMVAVIGPPSSNNGSEVYARYMKHVNTFNPMNSHTAAHQKVMETFFKQAEGRISRTMDQPYTENKYSLREFFLCNPVQQFYEKQRFDINPLSHVLKEKTWGYNIMRHHWTGSSTVIKQLPSSHPRLYWNSLRSFWF